MTKIIENISRPGQNPLPGDWIKETTTINGVVVSVVEREFHS